MNHNDELRKRVSSGLFWTFGERILAQGVSFFVSIILARRLTPDHYGVVALVVIAINILNVFVTSGLGSALVQKKKPDDLDYSTACYSGFVLSIFFLGLVFLISPLIAEFFNMPLISPLMRVLAIKLPISSINAVQQAYVSKNLIFKKFFFSTLIGTVISAGVGIGLAYSGFGAWALVFQYLTNSIIDTIVLFITVSWKPRKMFSFTRFQQLWSFGWKILAADMLQAIYDDLRSFAIGKKYTSSDLAYYNRGQQLTNIIVVNVNTSITKVLFPTMANTQDDIEKVKSITRRAIRISSYVMSPMLVGLAIVSKPLISVLLTDKWLPAVPYLRLMCLANLFIPMHTANIQAVKSLGKSGITLKLEIIKKIYYTVVLLITLFFFDSPIYIVAGFVICTLIAVLINAWPNIKLLNYSLKEQALDIIPNILLAIIMGILVSLIQLITLPTWFLLILQILLGFAIYILLSIISTNDSFNYLMSLFRSFRKKQFERESDNER